MTEVTRVHNVYTSSGVFAESPPDPAAITEITRSDGLITTEQAAALCGVSPKAVHGWVTHKRLRAAGRDGWRLLFNLVDVARLDHARGPNASRAADRPSWGQGMDAETVLAIARSAAETAGAPTRVAVVYYLRFADRIKIGTSTYLHERLMSIPHDRLLATEPGGAEIERQRHSEFAEFRIVGEWFSPAEPLMAHIASLRRQKRRARR